MPFNHVSFARLASVELMPPCAFVYIISCLVFFGSCFLRHFLPVSSACAELGGGGVLRSCARSLALSARSLSYRAPAL